MTERMLLSLTLWSPSAAMLQRLRVARQALQKRRTRDVGATLQERRKILRVQSAGLPTIATTSRSGLNTWSATRLTSARVTALIFWLRTRR
jgi:hypothetical protein